MKMYVNNVESETTFKIKTRYYPKLLTPETMKSLESTQSKITKDEIVKNMPHLEIIEVVLVNCNIVNNHYQYDSRVLNMFVPNKLFGQLLYVSCKMFIFLKTFNSEFSNIDYGLLIEILSR